MKSRRSRLEQFIHDSATLDPVDCWPWPFALDRFGYGTVPVSGRKTLAHRTVYGLLVGPIPAGLTIDHLCRNRACVNPAHLEPVTLLENLRRAPGLPSTINVRKTQCVRGHPFDEANTYVWKGPNGRPRRTCRVCLAVRVARRALQKKEFSK